MDAKEKVLITFLTDFESANAIAENVGKGTPYVLNKLSEAKMENSQLWDAYARSMAQAFKAFFMKVPPLRAEFEAWVSDVIPSLCRLENYLKPDSSPLNHMGGKRVRVFVEEIK